MKTLVAINRSGWYWGALMVFGLALMVMALMFQYVKNEWPCLLCIHVRIGVTALILVAALGWLMRRQRVVNLVAHGLMLGVAIGLLDRSQILFGTERGTVFGECSMELGLPAWLALDKWFPVLYEVQSSCGYTPELAFGITMAEALLVMSWGLVLIMGLQLLTAVLSQLKPEWRD